MAVDDQTTRARVPVGRRSFARPTLRPILEEAGSDGWGALMQAERIRVMVTVKAYPTLSKQYDETVCVAGVRVDTGVPQHVRLFPVPFRDLEQGRQFDKYDLIEVDVVDHAKDPRPESRRPRLDSIKVVGHVPTDGNWERRARWVRPLVAESLCAIKREQEARGTSLGVFRPAEVKDFRLLKADDRSAWQEMMASQMNIFDQERKKLEAMPYRFVYRFRCNDSRCRGHEIGLLDWEAGAAYLKWRRLYSPEVLKEKIRQKWFTEIAGPRRDLHFFVGNLHKRPGQFMLLGAFYPPSGVMDQGQLF
ncbi:hypothetical protein [Streptomyces sp. Inha503]|uniref:hypothetical protein n=1 Tax=Streptomyces sp. Inha503 TaxID=3383314 RepID=UPI00399F4EC4